MESNAILSRVALKCGDEQFQDFNQSIYEEALKSANRIIARKYGIPNKVISFKLSDKIEDVNDTVYFQIEDIKAIYEVRVNGKQVYKQDLESTYNAYKFDLVDDVYVFDYHYFVDIENPQVKSLDDEITIYYTSIPEYDSLLSDYFIPQKFVDEQIEEASKVICKYGLAKFTDEIKVAKYTRLFQMLQTGSDFNKFAHEDRAWVKVKAWSPI